MKDITLIDIINLVNAEDKIHVYLIDSLTGEITEHISFFKFSKSPMATTFMRVYAGYHVHEICAWENGAIGIFISASIVNYTESEDN